MSLPGKVNIKDTYTRWSQTYDSDRNLTRDLDKRVTSDSLSGHYRTILELGCGTGKNTPFLSSIADQVVAIDFSLGMLSKARAKIEIGHVSFLVADITAPWPCGSDSIGLIVCNLVLEHIEHLTPIFAEAQRVLDSKGKFFISELHPRRQCAGSQARFERGDKSIQIRAFIHSVTDFTESASVNGLLVKDVKEWWHEKDQNEIPRLITLLIEKP
jgi:ubiquinone/menaquinone biosynthesis C-methylase UbiE